MLKRLTVPLILTLCQSLLVVPGLLAQGREQYLNLLAPPVKPITVVALGDIQYLLVCNTPASRLEIWSATQNPVLLDSVPTGLKPVSVAMKPSALDDGSRIVYTANWLGDSITAVRLARSIDGLEVNLLRTVWVGDEPMHINFLPEYPDGHPLNSFSGPGAPFHEHLLVVRGTPGLWAMLDPITLTASQAGSDAIDLKDLVGEMAVKEPRVIASVPAGATENVEFRVVALNERGGQTPDIGAGDRPHLDPTPFDFDLWLSDDPQTALASGGLGTAVADLGTTHLNMTIADNGDIYVVGQKARNLSVPVSNEVPGMSTPVGEALHRDQVVNETGFVTSMIWRIKNAGGPGQTIEVLDLNLDRNNPPKAVGFKQTITQPTDVVVYGDGRAGSRIFVTGFASDTFAEILVGPAGSSLATWRVSRFSIDNPNPFVPPGQLGGMLKGPRAFAILETGSCSDDVLYIYNWLDNTLGTIRISQLGLQQVAHTGLLEVRPQYVLDGQNFMFASSLSGTNTVSCGSCHIDGESDWLAWNLGDGKDVCAASGGDPQCVSTGPPAPGVLVENPGRKGPMITQTLRGLVNFEVESQVLQEVISNKPYHWRGDRGDFTQFNGAFDNLMAIPSPFLPGEKGIPDAEMNAYRDFIDSLHHRPSPEQPWDRRYSGTFFSAEGLPAAQQDLEADDETIGTLAQLGMKLFHIKDYDPDEDVVIQNGPAIAEFVTCDSCHLLPEGSDNIITETPGFSTGPAHPGPGDPIVRDQGIETAALRFLMVKEKRRFKYDVLSETFTNDGAVTANSGLIHTGADTFIGGGRVPKFGPLVVPAPGDVPIADVSNSIFDFNRGAFGINANGGTFTDDNFPNDEVTAITLFFRQLDTGIAPSVGLAFSVDQPLLVSQLPSVMGALNFLEGIALEANAGLVAQVEERGVGRRGYRYDPVIDTYIEVPVSGIPSSGDLTRVGVLTFAWGAGNEDNVVVFQMVPLGTEQRNADLNTTWTSTLPPGPAPGLPTLEGMIPNTAHRNIPLMDVNWLSVVISNANANRATSLFQQALLADGPPGGFGLARLQFDAPRRFRVRADDVEFGAKLRLIAANANDLATVPPSGPPNLNESHIILELNIHPGSDAAGPYWETNVELDRALYYAMMNGVTVDPNVLAVYFDPASAAFVYTSGDFDPAGTNWYWVEIDNNGTTGPGSWQNITIQ